MSQAGTGNPQSKSKSSAIAAPRTARAGKNAAGGSGSADLSHVPFYKRTWVKATGFVGFLAATASIFTFVKTQFFPFIPEPGQPVFAITWQKQMDKTWAPLDMATEPFKLDQDFLLSFSEHPNMHRYLLAIKGDGTVTIASEEQVKNARWSWHVNSPPPGETLMQLVSNHRLANDGADLADQLTALSSDYDITIAKDSIYEWDKGGCKKFNLGNRDLGSSTPFDKTWADAVVKKLRSIDGLDFHGWSYPVRPAGSSSGTGQGS